MREKTFKLSTNLDKRLGEEEPRGCGKKPIVTK